MAKKSEDDLYIINVSLGAESEPTTQFVGNGDRQFKITRGVDITVPKEVMNALDCAVIGMPEAIDGDQDKVRFVDRPRFPYTVKGRVSAKDAVAA